MVPLRRQLSEPIGGHLVCLSCSTIFKRRGLLKRLLLATKVAGVQTRTLDLTKHRGGLGWTGRTRSAFLSGDRLKSTNQPKVTPAQ